MGLRFFSRHRHLLWITALVLVASGTLLLAACGSTPDPNTSPTIPTGTTGIYTNSYGTNDLHELSQRMTHDTYKSRLWKL